MNIKFRHPTGFGMSLILLLALIASGNASSVGMRNISFVNNTVPNDSASECRDRCSSQTNTATYQFHCSSCCTYYSSCSKYTSKSDCKARWTDQFTKLTVTGISMADYLELACGIACNYGYDTPEGDKPGGGGGSDGGGCTKTDYDETACNTRCLNTAGTTYSSSCTTLCHTISCSSTYSKYTYSQCLANPNIFNSAAQAMAQDIGGMEKMCNIFWPKSNDDTSDDGGSSDGGGSSGGGSSSEDDEFFGGMTLKKFIAYVIGIVVCLVVISITSVVGRVLCCIACCGGSKTEVHTVAVPMQSQPQVVVNQQSPYVQPSQPPQQTQQPDQTMKSE